MAHIFVSHSKLDADFVAALKDHLRAAGFDCWVDTDYLEPGMDWRAEIDQGLADAAAVVVVMSPDAKTSEYVTYEWAFAVGAGKPVIPLLLKLKPVDLHKRLEVFQCLNFTDRDQRPWERLTQRFQSLTSPLLPLR